MSKSDKKQTTELTDYDTRYCELCFNINQLSTKSDEIVHICTACENVRPGSADDSLLQTDNIIEMNDAYRILIKYGRYDKVNPNVEKECPKCHKSKTMKKIRIGPELRQMFLCPLCDYSEL